MNLFWKKVFGGLTPTEKLEKEEEALLLAYKRYCDIELSEQLKEYTALFQTVKAASFKEKKKTLQNRKFKDTEEYRDFRKYEKLHRNAKLKSYYDELNSVRLAEFLAFKNSPDYEKLGLKKEIDKDPMLQKFKTYEKSSAYKNYLRFHNSFVVQEYEKLKAKVSTDDFIERKIFWENNNRWQTTEEYTIEQRYHELQKTDDIKFYEFTDPQKFGVIEKWALSFEDNFDGEKLNKNRWKNGYYHRAAALKKIYSFAGEKQAYSDGANIKVGDSLLKINTIQEKTEATAWDSKIGFITQEFNFSSGIINTGESFQQEHGLIKAKIRIVGSSHISHAFWLGADGKLPHISIFNFDGKKISVNAYSGNGKSVSAQKETVKGISPFDFYIYTLEWTNTELIWRINNIEIFRTSKSLPKQTLFPAFNSFIGAHQHGGQGSLEVDWIRIYTKK
ncbi:MAG: family 16 glycosylhydrolase [Prevotellaceae bacterium]|jgi:hypothetical protein|nr:family 16 glycosylhydrolase [Prevotellaceae bacterium]